MTTRRSLRTRAKVAKVTEVESEEDVDSSGSDFEEEIKKDRQKRVFQTRQSSESDDEEEMKTNNNIVGSKRRIIKNGKKPSKTQRFNLIPKANQVSKSVISENKKSDDKSDTKAQVVPNSLSVPGVSLSESDSSDSENVEDKPKVAPDFNLMQVSVARNEEKEKKEVEAVHSVHSQLEALAQSHEKDLKPWGAEHKHVSFSKKDEVDDDIKSMLRQQERDLHHSDDDEDGKSEHSEANLEDHESKGPSEEQKSIEVMVEFPDNVPKKKRKEFDLEAHLKRKLQKAIRDRQEWMHKTHILCLIAHLQYVQSNILSKTLLKAVALSVVPKAHCITEAKKHNLLTLRATLEWFGESFQVLESKIETPNIVSLIQASGEKKAASNAELVLLFLSILRALGWRVRLVMNFAPVPLKPPKENGTKTTQSNDAQKTTTQAKDKSRSIKKKSKVESGQDCDSDENEEKSKRTEDESKSLPLAKRAKQRIIISQQKVDEEPQSETEPVVKRARSVAKERSKINSKLKNKTNESGSKLQKPQSSNYCTTAESKKSTGTATRSSSRASCSRGSLRIDDNEDFKPNPKDTKSSTKKLMTNKSKVSSITGATRRSNRCPTKVGKTSYKELDSDDCESTPAASKKTSSSPVKLTPKAMREIEHRKKPKDRDKSAYGRKLKSPKADQDSDYDESSKKTAKRRSSGCKEMALNVYWLEVFDEQKKLWVCVDVFRRKIDCPASMPASLYVFAVDEEARLKDVTRRYRAKDFMTAVRQQRVNAKWLEDALEPISMKKDEREDMEMEKTLSEQPFPTNVGAFKNHPLYVLPRHLLKFEAIYPPDAPTLHFFRGEPVYARECVHTLHCRVTWLKEGRVVRINEQPYKVVKGRPKWDRMTASIVTGQPLEVFGFWQTEIYVPPPAEKGKVPRNEYGNVELFKPWMLPKGTVHLPISGINRVAKKLNIDCAAAMIGWDFHSGGCHPVFDGFVVCQEHEEVLLEAWQQDQEAKEKKEADRKEKRVLDNWKKLVKGLLIHQKIKLKYGSKSTQGKKK